MTLDGALKLAATAAATVSAWAGSETTQVLCSSQGVFAWSIFVNEINRVEVVFLGEGWLAGLVRFVFILRHFRASICQQ